MLARQFHRVSKAPFAVVLMTLACACFNGSVMANPFFSDLAPSEQNMADTLAASQPWQPSDNTNLAKAHTLGVQTLSIERDERKKGRRELRARVYQFNYNSQQSRLVLINLDEGSVDKIQVIDSVHLPLNLAEIALARSLVEQDEGIMQQLNDIQRHRGLNRLNDLSPIEVKASIFEPDNAAHPCSIERCALLSLFDQSRTVFVVEPLVNLQAQQVTTLKNNF